MEIIEQKKDDKGLLKGKTILLIEDSQTIRFMYRGILSNYGFNVIEAENGEKGFELALERKPDLILLDLILPDIHGLDVLKKIRSYEITRNIPVLVITNLKEIDDVQKAINLGANYYGYKGSDSPQKILFMVKKLLEKKHQQEEDGS
jgi:two-component system alkaline phosphatase synthesis response regulator PhoP